MIYRIYSNILPLVTRWDIFLQLAVGGAGVIWAEHAAAKRGPFAATTGTIGLSFVLVQMVWVLAIRVPQARGLALVVPLIAVGKMWHDLFKRFPPGGSREDSQR